MQPRLATHFVVSDVPEDRGVVACNGHQQYEVDHNGHQQNEDDRNEAVASNDATIKHLLTLTPRSGSLFHNAKPMH